MRRLALLVASAVAIIAGSISPGLAASTNKDPGEESQNVAAATDWFTYQRLAPNGAVNPNAYAAVAGQAALLPTVGGAWAERTNLAGADGSDFSDPPAYIDPTSNFSNSGAGDRWVGGRMTALASAPDGALFAGAADGGVWKTTDGGATWTPLTDAEGTLSIGALLIVPNVSGYTVYAGTGEANTSSDSYAGIGVLASTDRGSSWNRVGSSELNGALIFRLVQNGTRLLAATSHGLYSFDTQSNSGWTVVLQPAGPRVDDKNFNLAVGNLISDVAVRPGTGGSQVVAVAGWRAGAPTNGFYISSDGGAPFTYLANPPGWVPAKAEGRATLAYSAAGDRAHAILHSPYLLSAGTNGKTLLQGVYESAAGNRPAPWTKAATSEKLQASGSAQARSRIGIKGYGPGIQTRYNQFLAVDPGHKDHHYLRLDEGSEKQKARPGLKTRCPHRHLGVRCFADT